MSSWSNTITRAEITHEEEEFQIFYGITNDVVHIKVSDLQGDQNCKLAKIRYILAKELGYKLAGGHSFRLY